MLASKKIWTSFKIGHVGSKTRSVGQILKKKNCKRSRGHIFSPIHVKLGQNVGTSLKIGQIG